MKRILKINKADNVAVTLVDGVKAGEVWSEGDETVTLKEDIGSRTQIRFTQYRRRGSRDKIRLPYRCCHP